MSNEKTDKMKAIVKQCLEVLEQFDIELDTILEQKKEVNKWKYRVLTSIIPNRIVIRDGKIEEAYEMLNNGEVEGL